MMRRLPFPMAISTALRDATGEDEFEGLWQCSLDSDGLPGLVNIQKTMENHHRNSDFSHE